MKRTLRVMFNKYLLISTFMLVWLVFFDSFNLFRRIDDWQQLREVRQKAEYYEQETQKVMEADYGLRNDPEKLERFAREKYYMHKESEEIFIIEEDKEN